MKLLKKLKKHNSILYIIKMAVRTIRTAIFLFTNRHKLKTIFSFRRIGTTIFKTLKTPRDTIALYYN